MSTPLAVMRIGTTSSSSGTGHNFIKCSDCVDFSTARYCVQKVCSSCFEHHHHHLQCSAQAHDNDMAKLCRRVLSSAGHGVHAVPIASLRLFQVYPITTSILSPFGVLCLCSVSAGSLLREGLVNCLLGTALLHLMTMSCGRCIFL